MPEDAVDAIKIGLIGLDTSHVVAFTRLLNDPDQEFAVPGGRIVAAFPGGSPDFALSRDRVAGFTNELRDKYGVAILDSPEAVAERCDGVLLTSVDGRVHREQFARIAPRGRPTFIDKPFALSAAEAEAMADLSRRHQTPLMSCSALRYAEALTEALADTPAKAVIGADAYGPMAIEPTQPGLFWYSIHAVEMLFAAMGPGCIQVRAAACDDHEVITGVWNDGRIGTVRGNRRGNNAFGVLIHRETGTQLADVASRPKPTYASLLEKVMAMFRTDRPPLDIAETIEIVRFIEAANRSRDTGETVPLTA